MKATARRTASTSFTHRVDVRAHQLTVDEPADLGGRDEGPTPQELLAASLAACTAITLEMYAERKGWDLGEVEVEVQYEPAQRGEPTRFEQVIRLPTQCSEEQQQRLLSIAAKCPVHRTLEGEVSVEERIELADRATP